MTSTTTQRTRGRRGRHHGGRSVPIWEEMPSGVTGGRLSRSAERAALCRPGVNTR